MLTLSAYRSRSNLHVDAYASHFVGTVLHGAGKEYLIFSPKTAQRDALHYDEWQGVFLQEDELGGFTSTLSHVHCYLRICLLLSSSQKCTDDCAVQTQKILLPCLAWTNRRT